MLRAILTTRWKVFAQGGIHYSVANIRSLPSDMFFRFLIAEDIHPDDEDGEPRTKPLYLDVCQMMRRGPERVSIT